MTIDCKTNTITAAARLLKNLNIEGAVLTVKALMTQTEVAVTIARTKEIMKSL